MFGKVIEDAWRHKNDRIRIKGKLEEVFTARVHWYVHLKFQQMHRQLAAAPPVTSYAGSGAGYDLVLVRVALRCY